MERPVNFPHDPAHLWDHFLAITQIPRPSGKEEKMRAYILQVAEQEGLPWKSDSVGNVVVYKPGSPGLEDHGPVIIQNHMDMVCDQVPELQMNFSEDPLKIYVEKGEVRAQGTTLGADNGIGMAAALASMTDKTLIHPPLELLFTIDEETGLKGALGLDHTLLSGKKMLNLDTEEWGSLYVGCAGGFTAKLSKNLGLHLKDNGDNFVPFYLEVKNLCGGHSGIDIHRQRGNAIKLLTELLVRAYPLQIEVAEIRGGRAHNIIPRSASAILWINKFDIEEFKSLCEKALAAWESFLPKEDHDLEIIFDELEEAPSKTLPRNLGQEIISLLTLMPHGAHSFILKDREKEQSEVSEPLVALSNNLAKVLFVDGELYLEVSVRFFDRQEALSLEQKLKALAKTFQLKLEVAEGYPSWKPIFQGNKLLELVKSIYKEQWHSDAQVLAIHAGLECGILKEKLGDIEIVSFGPTIQGAHSPSERVNIETVGHFWKLYKEVLSRL